ncbi:MAG: hypothetical protein QXW71_00605 [Thermoplasmata archaeon]
MAFERGVVYGPAQLFHRIVRFLTQTEDATWQPNTFFSRGTIIRPIPGYRFVCIQEGITGSSPPNWNSVASKQGVMYKQTINDGSCIWQVLSTTFSPGWSYILNFSNRKHNRLHNAWHFATEILSNLSIPHPVIEFELYMNSSAKNNLYIQYSTFNNLVNFGLLLYPFAPSVYRIRFYFHDENNYHLDHYLFPNITSSCIVKLEYVNKEIKLYINNTLQHTRHIRTDIPTRPDAKFIIAPFDFSHFDVDYVPRIKWVKIYNQNQLLCHWNFENILFSYNPLTKLSENLSSIYMSSSDSSILYIPLAFIPNQANDYANILFLHPNPSILLIGNPTHSMYKPVIRMEAKYELNDYYSLNFSGTELERYETCGWYSNCGLPTWNVLTPTEYFIQGNNSYFQIVTKTGDATHFFYFGEYFSFYPVNFYIPVTIFSFQKANTNYTSKPNVQAVLLSYLTNQWFNRTDHTRFTDMYLTPLENQYRPLFPITIGNSDTPFGIYHNLYYTLGQGLSLMTYLNDSFGNDYIVFREITNNEWYQWYAVKVE